MRTSGSGRDGMMMVIPMLVIVLVGTILLGGPHEALVYIERSLEAIVSWVGDLAS